MQDVLLLILAVSKKLAEIRRRRTAAQQNGLGGQVSWFHGVEGRSFCFCLTRMQMVDSFALCFIESWNMYSSSSESCLSFWTGNRLGLLPAVFAAVIFVFHGGS